MLWGMAVMWGLVERIVAVLSSERVPPHPETSNHQIENKNLVMGSRWVPDTKADWPTDRRS
jgi:hypothetical protein